MTGPKVDHSYAAGFFDGEGHIGLEKRNDRNNQYYLRLTTTQKTPEPLYALQALYGGRVFLQKQSKGRATDVWRHRVERCNARLMLEAMLPYLIVKRERAEEVLQIVPVRGPCAEGGG